VVNAKSFYERAGKESLARVFEIANEDFAAIIAANDLLALGCIDAMTDAGLRCPNDISVTRFNNMPFLNCLNLSLTTVTFRTMRWGFDRRSS
jgi:LacI family transcriptional regulator